MFVDVSDPIGAGFIVSVARPGANITGMLSVEPSIVGKWLAMLKEIAPNLSRVMLLGNSKTTAFDYFLRSAAAIAPSLDLNLVPQQVISAADVESATEAFARTSNGGLMILPELDNPHASRACHCARPPAPPARGLPLSEFRPRWRSYVLRIRLRSPVPAGRFHY